MFKVLPIEVFGTSTFEGEVKSSLGLDADGLLIQNLLNCLLREMSEQLEVWLSPLRSDSSCLLQTRLRQTGREIIFRVGVPASLTGVYEYLGESHSRANAQASWQPLSGLCLSEFIFQELSTTYTHLREPDFTQQVHDSHRVSRLIMESSPILPSLRSYLDSEQSVTFGHPFHPSPKSRTGFTDKEVRAYSPEFGQPFQLHYFGVQRAQVIQESLLENEAVDYVRCAFDPAQSMAGRDEPVVLPVHPWEARYLLALPEVQEALCRGQLKDLGVRGGAFFATSSVRTLYSPEQPFFYKMSLHVRVTNCIRRNALPEMRSAVALTRLLRKIRTPFATKYPDFNWLEEPAFLSLRLSEDKEETEGFGMILRESLSTHLRGEELALVAAALFGNQARGRLHLRQRVIQSGIKPVEWFAQYLEVLLPPVLDLFFEYGLMSEPHLQNTVVCLKEGLPSQILLRDLDNFRLLRDEWGAQNVTPRALLNELIFEKDEAWNRFVYCLVVNHLNETIYSLSRCLNAESPAQALEGVETTERQLWVCLREALLRYCYSHRHTDAPRRIGELLEQPGLPAKGNLVTRFRRAVDRDAIYFQIPNPLRSHYL